MDRLHKKKNDLEAQIEEAKLPPAEARKRLLKRVKTDNSTIKTLDKRLIKLRKLIDNYKKDIKDMSSDLTNKQGEEAQKKKYDILYKKDKEMTNYIEGFEDNRKRELKEISEYEQQILEILQNTSKNLTMMNQLTGKVDYTSLRGAESFKKREAKNSK